MNSSTAPQLAPPGAGLPALELFIARRLFAWKCWTGSQAAFDARFRQERALINALVKDCDAASASRRVLIRRCRGLEDSSRYWSVWMTLDHLRIVNTSIVRVIGSLTKGEVPPGVASTAAVKPGAEVTAEVVAAYEASCDAALAATAAPDLKTSVRFAHPWFGPLDAFGWHAIAGTHMAIHRVQIERIREGLAGQPAAS